MKRLFSWILACALILSLLPAGAAAEEEYAYSGGSGTQEDPYLIATVEDLRMVKNNGGAHFLQIADIDIGNSGGYVWWDESDAITLLASGSYNGGGYRILNFKSRYTGLFARNLGTVENVTMENVSVETVNEFTTQLGALVNWNQGTVKNCTVQGSVSVRTTAFYDDPNFFVGGIVGQNGSWEYDGMGLVTGCTLDGSGAYGLQALDCAGIVLEDCEISHCTYGAVSLTGCREVCLRDGVILDCRDVFTLVGGVRCEDVRVERTSISGCTAGALSCFDQSRRVSFTGCTMENCSFGTINQVDWTASGGAVFLDCTGLESCLFKEPSA